MKMDKIAYLKFLESKLPVAELEGIEPPSDCHESLKPHQIDICKWAIKGGRRAVFAQFGLGKTRMHLQIAKWVVDHVGRDGISGKFLIVAPLGVRQEFISNDGPAMGLTVQYVRSIEEAKNAESKILITNYERVRDGDLDPKLFAGAGLDESSVLRSYGSKTYQTFLDKFAGVQFRYVFTATPSPNRYKELIHYAGFLGVMDTGEALTRFFQRDSSQANNLTLYPHMEGQFWHWLRSWACFIQSPADLGYDSTGYDLPKMNVFWHRIEIDHTANWNSEGRHFDSWGQAQIFIDEAQGLVKSSKVKRDSILMRVEKAAGIIEEAGISKHWLLWHDLEDERRSIEKNIKEAVTVWGTQDLEKREESIQDFAHGKSRILATKPVIAGSGCNFQRHCSDAIFLGVGYKFNDFIQAIHRIARFQQPNQVNIHIISLDTEDKIVEELKAKWRRHDELVQKMTELLKEHRLNPSSVDILQRTIGVNREERTA